MTRPVLLLASAVWFSVGLLPRQATAAFDGLELCHLAEVVGEESERMIAQGLRRAERELALNPDDAAAHFAVFCNIAKRLSTQEVGLRAIFDLRRLHRELDRSIELDPAYSDAIAAKGALLFYSPAFVGGDVDEGERLLRVALDLDPGNPARLVLVDVLAYRNRVDEAAIQAQTAARLLHGDPDFSTQAGALAILARLCGNGAAVGRTGELLAELCAERRELIAVTAPAAGIVVARGD